MVRSSRLVSFIPRYVVDFALDCDVAKCAVDSCNGQLAARARNRGKGRGGVPLQVESFSMEMGSSFGGARTTGALGSNFPPVILMVSL